MVYPSVVVPLQTRNIYIKKKILKNMESHTEFESKAKAHSQKTSRSHLIQNRVWGGGGGGSYKLGQLTSMIWAIYLLPFKLKEDLKRQFFFFFFSEDRSCHSDSYKRILLSQSIYIASERTTPVEAISWKTAGLFN